jgi:hypothetical protein
MRTIIRLKESFQSDFKATLEKAKEFDTQWVKVDSDTIKNKGWYIIKIAGSLIAIQYGSSNNSKYPFGFLSFCKRDNRIKKVSREENRVYAKSVKGAKEVIRDWETRRTSPFEDYLQGDFI